MKNRIRTLLRVLLLCVFLLSTAMALYRKQEKAAAEKTYEGALAVAQQPPEQTLPAPTLPVPEDRTPAWVPAPVENDPVVQELAQLNLAALREINPDVVGWIHIPDTGIHYPLLQGEDNEFYLNHTWEGQANSVGAVFLECQNSPDLTDYNTIIYGHNMNDGAMFAPLELFALRSFWQTHPYVYILTGESVFRYEIFAFFQANVESLAYGMNPQRTDTKEKFLNLARDEAWYDTDLRPAVTDRILTLSTCSGSNYDYRYVVQARLPMIPAAG